MIVRDDLPTSFIYFYIHTFMGMDLLIHITLIVEGIIDWKGVCETFVNEPVKMSTFILRQIID